MYESKFDAFFEQSFRMLTSTDNIQIFKDKITELDEKMMNFLQNLLPLPKFEDIALN